MPTTEVAPAIEVTPKAISKIRQAFEKQGVSGGLRLGVLGGGCSGLSYQFKFDTKPRANDHIFDFDGDLYGDVLRVRFLHRIRDERKFNGIDELKAQIEKDSSRARNYFRHQGVKNMLEIL